MTTITTVPPAHDPGPVPEHQPAEPAWTVDELLGRARRFDDELGLPELALAHYRELDARLAAGEPPPTAWS